MDHDAAHRLRRRAEEHPWRHLTRAVLPPEIEPESRARRRDAAASAMNAHADARREAELAVFEVRHAAFALPLFAVFAFVGKQPLCRIVQVGVVERERQHRHAARDFVDRHGARARQRFGTPLNGEPPQRKEIGRFQLQRPDTNRRRRDDEQPRGDAPCCGHLQRARSVEEDVIGGRTDRCVQLSLQSRQAPCPKFPGSYRRPRSRDPFARRSRAWLSGSACAAVW